MEKENRFLPGFNNHPERFKTYYEGLDDELRPKRRQMLSFSVGDAQELDQTCKAFNIDPTVFIRAAIDHFIYEARKHPEELKEAVQWLLEYKAGQAEIDAALYRSERENAARMAEAQKTENKRRASLWASLSESQKAAFNKWLFDDAPGENRQTIEAMESWYEQHKGE